MIRQLIEDYVELSSAELDEVLEAAEHDRRVAEAKLAAASAVISNRGSYRDAGHSSMRVHLKAVTNCSGSEANRIRKRAAVVNDHAAIGDAWLAGHVGTDQIDRLASARAHPRAGHRFAEFAPQLLTHAEHLEYSDFAQVVDHFEQQADPDGAFDDQQFQEDERFASVAVTNGAVDVRASGGNPLVAAEIDAVFKLAVEAEFDKDCVARRAEFGDDAVAHPLARTSQQRKFDALHSIFMSYAAVPADATTPKPLVNIVIDAATFAALLEGHGLRDGNDVLGGPGDTDLLARRCATSTGTPVHPDVALRAAISGRVRRVIIDADGVIVDAGRTRRLFTGSARDAAQLLVTTCTHRGCAVPAELCQVDHRNEWAADAGRTDQANAIPLCGSHNRWKHTEGLRTRRAANGRVRLIRSDGSVIKPVGERDPEWAEPPPAWGDPPSLPRPAWPTLDTFPLRRAG